MKTLLFEKSIFKIAREKSKKFMDNEIPDFFGEAFRMDKPDRKKANKMDDALSPFYL